MKTKKCTACGQPFQARSQNPQQTYCSTPECQRARRRLWQRLKLQTDPDYQDNQARARQAWTQRNLDYWRQYRKSNPKYVERNRALQLDRNNRASMSRIAKMDAWGQKFPILSGIYHLQIVPDSGIAKRDAWTVEITRHVCACVPEVKIAKR